MKNIKRKSIQEFAKIESWLLLIDLPNMFIQVINSLISGGNKKGHTYLTNLQWKAAGLFKYV